MDTFFNIVLTADEIMRIQAGQVVSKQVYVPVDGCFVDEATCYIKVSK